MPEMLSLEPSKFNAEAGEVLAVITKLKVGFVQSLLATLTMALAVPTVVGVNKIVIGIVSGSSSST